MGLEAAYEPKMSENLDLRVYVGGEPSVTFGIPGDLLKKIRFKAYAGARIPGVVFQPLDPVEYVFVDVSYPTAKSFKLAMRSADGTTERGHVPGRFGWRRHGAPGFAALSAYGIGTVSGFRCGNEGAGGRRHRDVAVGSFSDDGAGRQRGHSCPLGGEADKNVRAPKALASATGHRRKPICRCFRTSSEFAASTGGRGQELMLLYVTDNGSPNNLQFTDIKWTRFDGTNWSVPATIHTNTQAEFSPQVAYDGNGDAIAVWERVADPNFNQTNLTAMAAQMEIVWARWNRGAGRGPCRGR